jgi:hypothetical protein
MISLLSVRLHPKLYSKGQFVGSIFLLEKNLIRISFLHFIGPDPLPLARAILPLLWASLGV